MAASKSKVLVVDDERVIADTLAIVLRQHGYDATVAYSGLQLIERARLLRPDLLIADAIMPHMNGIDAANKVCEFLPDCHVLVLTYPSHLAEFGRRVQSSGRDFDIIAKPAHPPALLHWCDVGGRHNANSCQWCHDHRGESGGFLHDGEQCAWCQAALTQEEREQQIARRTETAEFDQVFQEHLEIERHRAAEAAAREGEDRDWWKRQQPPATTAAESTTVTQEVVYAALGFLFLLAMAAGAAFIARAIWPGAFSHYWNRALGFAKLHPGLVIFVLIGALLAGALDAKVRRSLAARKH